MAHRRQWLTRAGIGAAAAVLLTAGVAATALGDAVLPGAGDDHSSASPSVVRPSAQAMAGTSSGGLSPFGAFTDSGAEGVRRLGALQTWLGGSQVRVAHTYLPGDDWADIEGDGDLLQPWAQWTRAEPGRLFVLNVPMQQDNEGDVPDYEVHDLIQQGASGADDTHFAKLAQRLVQLGLPDTVIVLGWEMNGTTYTHRCGPDPTGWKAYWNRIVATMRAVPGQHFRFDFTPSRGLDDIAWTRCYPGDQSVDVIGMDSYDQPPGEPFYDQVTEPYGLQKQVDFAAAHKKEISYPEWGLFKNGDDPDYVSLMLAWMAGHHPLYQTITDYCPHGVLQCTQNPKASQAYRALLFGRMTVPVQEQAAPSEPGPYPSMTRVPPGAAHPTGALSGSAQPGTETCVPMPLTGELKQGYDSGEGVRTAPAQGARGSRAPAAVRSGAGPVHRAVPSHPGPVFVLGPGLRPAGRVRPASHDDRPRGPGGSRRRDCTLRSTRTGFHRPLLTCPSSPDPS